MADQYLPILVTFVFAGGLAGIMVSLGRLLGPHHMVFDCVYGPVKTSLLRAADDAGARAANGLPMLLHQGALSFSIWFDREAPIEEMRKALAL